MPRQLYAVEPFIERIYPRFYDLSYPYSVARNRYRHWIGRLLENGESSRVLDCGCGNGYHSVTAELAARSRIELIGTDIDFEALLGNRLIQRRAVADAGVMPFESSSFDLIVCESVLEHLLVPDQFLREAFRILRPGGKLLLLTSGRLHPFMIINRWLSRARVGAARLLFLLLRRPLSTTFPAYYRCNTKRALSVAATAAGFHVSSLHVASGTFGYLRFSKWLIILGALFDRMTDNRLLEFSKISLLAILERTVKHES
jgi:SAM-dependent methyltransferase